MTEKRQPSEKKIRAVKELAKLIDENRTIIFCSIKGLPALQFQKIKKQLSDKVKIKVLKKSTLLRALEASKKKAVTGLKEYIKEDTAVVISQLDPFELSGILGESKSPVRAKIGQEAEEDIEIEAGPTELTAGPIISDFGALGIKIEVKDGKIEIKEPKIIVKKGEKVGEEAASLMNKLDIKPFSIGFVPLVAYDSETDKIYTDIKIDKEKTIEELKSAFSKAGGFAIAIGLVCNETIKFLIAKAGNEEKVLAKLIKEPESAKPEPEVPAKEPKASQPEGEEKLEDNKEEKEEKSAEEEKKDAQKQEPKQEQEEK